VIENSNDTDIAELLTKIKNAYEEYVKKLTNNHTTPDGNLEN